VKKILKNPWFWGVVAFIVVDSVFRFTPLLKAIPYPPPVVSTVADFELVDHNGQPFTRADLDGSVHIVGFFFTSCPSLCPTLMRQMKKLQEKIDAQAPMEKVDKTELRLMAISVDPDTDTPERLRATMQEYGLDPERWTMLTGDPAVIQQVVVGGFKTMIGDKTELAPGVYDIAHSGKLAMLDEDGGVRGYYAADTEGMDEAFWLAVRTVREQRIQADKSN